MTINRKKFVRSFLLLATMMKKPFSLFENTDLNETAPPAFRRVRPGDAGWPSADAWEKLNKQVNGNLTKLQSPFTGDSSSLFKNIRNPYYIGDHPALTQTLGWVDAWNSQPSAYAVDAKSTADVVNAVHFARENKLRLVVKGGAHSYLGKSSAADSLLIWTRHMNAVTVHDQFTPADCASAKAQPAVTIEAGAIWGKAYHEVTTKNGRYVQGGGCLTVGVAGLVLGGGFGSFSKYYGLAAAALLEAEIVLADGSVQLVNENKHPDLFRALKGGGGGTFGVVTKLTLRTRDLPEFFGATSGRISANSDDGFQKLIKKIMQVYRDHLLNPAWGEQIVFHSNRSISVKMLFRGLSKNEAQDAWQDFENWTKENTTEYTWTEPFQIILLPARHLWDPSFLRKFASGSIGTDNQPDAPEENIFWKGDGEQAGQFIHGYHSGWLSQNLLKEENMDRLANTFFETSRMWSFSLHFNKGLAGCPPDEKNAALDTSINSAVVDAFALLILAGEEDPAMIGVAEHEPNLQEARAAAASMRAATEHFKKGIPFGGSYVNETDFFEENWQESFWGSNYKKLQAVKKTYDPQGLFFVHHGVGSEDWSADGFTKIR